MAATLWKDPRSAPASFKVEGDERPHVLIGSAFREARRALLRLAAMPFSNCSSGIAAVALADPDAALVSWRALLAVR